AGARPRPRRLPRNGEQDARAWTEARLDRCPARAAGAADAPAYARGHANPSNRTDHLQPATPRRRLRAPPPPHARALPQATRPLRACARRARAERPADRDLGRAPRPGRTARRRALRDRDRRSSAQALDLAVLGRSLLPQRPARPQPRRPR